MILSDMEERILREIAISFPHSFSEIKDIYLEYKSFDETILRLEFALRFKTKGIH